MLRPSVLDEVCDSIGYTATCVVAALFAGRYLYVPSSYRTDHPLVALIGHKPLRQLIEDYGGDRVCVPSGEGGDRFRRDWRIAQALCDTGDVPAIAEAEGLTVRRVEQIRSELVERGWLDWAAGARRRAATRAAPAASAEIFRTSEVVRDSPLLGAEAA